MVEHVGVDITVLSQFGLGEDGIADIAKRVDPGADNLSATRDDIGEDGRFRLNLEGASAAGRGRLAATRRYGVGCRGASGRASEICGICIGIGPVGIGLGCICSDGGLRAVKGATSL